MTPGLLAHGTMEACVVSAFCICGHNANNAARAMKRLVFFTGESSLCWDWQTAINPADRRVFDS
jgi:hypothetical protein